MSELSRSLRLVDEPQDWGIFNSDPSRVEEFLRFCELETLTSVQQFAVGELVLASLNDAMLDQTADDRWLAEQFDRLLALDLHEIRQHIRYWSSLNGEDVPIGAFLRRQAIPA